MAYRRTQPRGISVIEVAAAIALFMLTVVLLTTVVSSALNTRNGASEALAVDTMLGDLVGQLATVNAASLASGDFYVPNRCPDPLPPTEPQFDGAEGRSCVLVGAREFEVLWTVTLAGGGGVNGYANWADITARSFVDGDWRARSLSVALPPRLELDPSAPGATVRLVATPVTIRQGTSAPLTVTALGPTGQPVSGVSVTATPADLDPVTSTTDATGRAVLTLSVAANTPIGPLTVALVGGDEPTTASVTVTSAPATVAVTPTSLTVAAGQRQQVEVRVFGTTAQPAGAVAVESSATSGLLVSPMLTTNPDGVVVFYVAVAPGTGSGPYVVTFTAGEATATLTVTVP